MRKSLTVILLAFLMPCLTAGAQSQEFDVFNPITKYMAQGNSDALSAWFADNLEISVLSQKSDASRSQARQIIKAFFQSYTPRSFTAKHTAGRSNMKYLLGDLSAGGENFHVIIFVCYKDGAYRIQQLKIDRF